MNRTREFFEELGQAGDYPTAILELEFDEGVAGQADDRLFVLSRLETKSTPKRAARIQMLSVDPPTDPLQLDAIDLVQEVPAGQSAAYDYDIVALDLIPEQNLLLAVGRALPLPVDPPAVTPPTQLLLMLLRHGPLTSGGPDELIKVGELRSDLLPLKDVDGVGGRSLLGLFDVEVTQVGGDLIAFVLGPMGTSAKGLPWGIAAARLTPNAPQGTPVIQWFQQGTQPGDPLYVFDPFWDIRHGAQASCAVQLPTDQVEAAPEIRVNHIDFAQVSGGSAPGHYLYAACNRFNQVLEFKIDNFASTTHFTETPDCRPYIWPPFGLLPVVLVPRYQQTLLMLRSAPASGG